MKTLIRPRFANNVEAKSQEISDQAKHGEDATYEIRCAYKEIQDWVQEKYGFHVTNLNIAQVKQKHGIIERENYNKPKSPDSKQPGTSDMRI